MIIGVPRERKTAECRVAITPDGVRELVRIGAKVLIETNAGELSGFSDEEYAASEAEVVPSLADVWNRCDLLVKVKEPAPEEVEFFRPDLAVFSFLHLAVTKELTAAMVEKGVVGLDYDLVTLDNGRLPILEPMSIIAGKLSIQCGAYALQSNCGGRGVLLGGSVGVPPAKVVVLGAGAAGSNAARVALGMGAEVSILDINTEKLAPFSNTSARARTVYSTPTALENEVVNADLLIGSVLIPGALAPKLVTRELLKTMRSGSVLVDISIDQGGVAETSRPTTITNPTYIEDGVVHYCVANMPALVPRTSTIALTNATLPWIKMLVQKGIEKTLRGSAPMLRSLTSYKGKLTNIEIGQATGIPALSAADTAALIGAK